MRVFYILRSNLYNFILKRSNYRLEVIFNMLRYSTKKEFYGMEAEDFFISKWFPEKNGSYIDIGSGNPIIMSNSYYFYKKGWTGILVDPLDFNMKLYKIFRRRDNHLQILVGKNDGVCNFYEFYPSELSTTIKEIADRLIRKKQGLFISSYQLKMRKLSEFQIKASPSDATFLSIDTEGNDFEVLSGIDFQVFRPRVIVIEDWEYRDSIGVSSKIKTFLHQNGYALKTWTGSSCVYLENSYAREV